MLACEQTGREYPDWKLGGSCQQRGQGGPGMVFQWEPWADQLSSFQADVQLACVPC